jgi:hypothetical protein
MTVTLGRRRSLLRPTVCGGQYGAMPYGCQQELVYPRIVSTDLDVLWLLASFDTLLKIHPYAAGAGSRLTR